MKKTIALLILTLTTATFAETVTLDQPIDIGSQITAMNVGSVRYNSSDNSWSINVQPVLSTQHIRISTNGVSGIIVFEAGLSVTVQRSEIEAALEIETIDDATVKQLNDTVRAIALQKVLAVLNQELTN